MCAFLFYFIEQATIDYKHFFTHPPAYSHSQLRKMFEFQIFIFSRKLLNWTQAKETEVTDKNCKLHL